MSNTPTDNVLSNALPFQPASTSLPQANDTYQSADADFTLYSADGYEFKVHKYQLIAASIVFRSMLSTCDSGTNTVSCDPQNNELKLTDNQVERCHSIRLFLDLIYGHTLNPPSSSFHKYLNVGTLLKKYDCEGPMQA